MQPPEFTFEGNLSFSEGHTATTQVSEILLKNIPGARQVIASCKENDKRGIDYWVETTSGKLLSADTKIRRKDYAPFGHDDLALETYSVLEKEKPGWTRDESKCCDYILWLWTDTGRWCMISFPQLCFVMKKHWETWRSAYRVARQHTPDNGNYHSECVFVPRREVWTAIYNHFGGVMNAK